jgi:hypothetical protein
VRLAKLSMIVYNEKYCDLIFLHKNPRKIIKII